MLRREISYSDLESVATPSVDESPFVDRLRANDDEAYDELVRTYHAAIYHSACRMLQNPGEAADVTQDVFIKVFRHIDRFRGDSSLKTWIYRIAFSEIMNRARWSRRRHIDQTLSIEEESEPSDSRPPLQLADDGLTPEAALERRERQEAFQTALWKLSYEHRSVVILRDIEGFSYGEVADVLGVSMGTVKSRLARARADLKKHLIRYLSVRSLAGRHAS